MTSPTVAALRRRALTLVGSLLLVVALAACGGQQTPEANGPQSVVQDALAKVAAKDVDGLRSLACAGQEDIVADQLALAGMSTGSELLPGVDIDALLDAVIVDTGGVELGTAAVTGETAIVPVTGSLKVTFDEAKIRPIIKAALEQQGTTMTDDQLDALLKTLRTYGQDLPLDQSIRLIQEGGAWKICQESLEAPAAS